MRQGQVQSFGRRGETGEIPRYKGLTAIPYALPSGETHTGLEGEKMVFAVDRHRKPLMPVTEKRARQLLDSGRAVIHKTIPFVIRIKDKEADKASIQPVILKIDPGSKHTGIAVVRRSKASVDYVLYMMQIDHRGSRISEKLTDRKAHRSARRRKLKKNRPARFQNRIGYKDSLPPSLQHRVSTTMTWVRRLMRWCPVSAIWFEYVNFDTHLLRNPEVRNEGRYQYGPLFEKELFGFLMEAFNGECAYCGSKNGPFQKDHAVSKANGGNDGIGNRVLACERCNQKKGPLNYDEYLKNKKDGTERIERIRKHLKDPLHDATAVNMTRGFLLRNLDKTGLLIVCYSGGRTAYNRSCFGVPKDHALDAACVGNINGLEGWQNAKILIAEAAGHGTRLRQHMDKYGFPHRKPFMRKKMNYGFQTGDYVKAEIPNGKYKGTYKGKIMIREKKSFGLSCKGMKQFDVNPDCCTLIQRKDGYAYSWK